MEAYPKFKDQWETLPVCVVRCVSCSIDVLVSGTKTYPATAPIRFKAHICAGPWQQKYISYSCVTRGIFNLYMMINYAPAINLQVVDCNSDVSCYVCQKGALQHASLYRKAVLKHNMSLLALIFAYISKRIRYLHATPIMNQLMLICNNSNLFKYKMNDAWANEVGLCTIDFVSTIPLNTQFNAYCNSWNIVRNIHESSSFSSVDISM